MRTTYAVHAPALSLSEAAMLPAMEAHNLPRNLILPDQRTYYPMPPVQPGVQPVDHHRRSTMTGRAALNHIKNASAKRPKR